MSPKSNRSGISYDENDPRSLSMPGGVRVTRARDMEAAIAGLPTADEVEQANEAAIEERPAGDVEQVEEEAPDYGTWLKVDLNAELNRREIEHDPKATNETLVDLLKADDEHRAEHGDGTPPSGD